jgi:hypothetical protein
MMALRRIRSIFATAVCAVAIVSFSSTALADGGSSGSGDDDDGEQTHLVLVEMNGSLVVVEMGETEVEQRCEQDNEFADNNVQTCTLVVG